MRVLVTGGSGHLGAAVIREFGSGHDVVAPRHAELDIADRQAVRATIERVRPDAIVNCAAYNDVDAAQRDPGPALEINAFGVLHLAQAAASTGAALVHYSTDFVFDGDTTTPYRETDRPSPRSFYGCTKLLGEKFAEDAPRHYLLRVESIFGGPTAGVSARDGSLGTIARKLRAGESTPVFVDRTVSPSYAPDIARATRILLERNAAPGLYHCVNAEHATWHDIARECAAILGVAPRLEPISVASVTLAAPRPKFCALDSSKIAAAGAPMRPWRDALREWLR